MTEDATGTGQGTPQGQPQSTPQEASSQQGTVSLEEHKREINLLKTDHGRQVKELKERSQTLEKMLEDSKAQFDSVKTSHSQLERRLDEMEDERLKGDPGGLDLLKLKRELRDKERAIEDERRALNQERTEHKHEIDTAKSVMRRVNAQEVSEEFKIPSSVLLDEELNLQTKEQMRAVARAFQPTSNQTDAAPNLPPQPDPGIHSGAPARESLRDAIDRAKGIKT